MVERRGSEDSVLQARLTAQLLAGAPAATVLDATHYLLAVQAQDPRGARLALRLRSRAQHASRSTRP